MAKFTANVPFYWENANAIRSFYGFKSDAFAFGMAAAITGTFIAGPVLGAAIALSIQFSVLYALLSIIPALWLVAMVVFPMYLITKPKQMETQTYYNHVIYRLEDDYKDLSEEIRKSLKPLAKAASKDMRSTTAKEFHEIVKAYATMETTKLEKSDLFESAWKDIDDRKEAVRIKNELKKQADEIMRKASDEVSSLNKKFDL